MPLFPVSPIVLDIVTPVTSHHLSADFSKHRRPSLELLGVILNSYIVISRAVFSTRIRIRMPWCYSLSNEELLLSACTEFEKPLEAQRERVGNERKYRKRIDITDYFLADPLEMPNFTMLGSFPYFSKLPRTLVTKKCYGSIL